MQSIRYSLYRPELDGLRALAVIAVIVNHMNPTWLPGGYLGVDSFFILSGYVVARSWVKKGDNNFLDFYRRRVRRLQPALVLMIILCILVGASLNILSWTHISTAISAIFGASNMLLLSNNLDYFGISSSENPFTNTWSLGVEEQFYLLFPFIIGRRKVLKLLTIGTFIFWLILQSYETHSSFYLMPARFWEIGIGIFIVDIEANLNKSNHLTLAGITGLTGLILLYNFEIDFHNTAIPLVVLMTGAIIIGSSATSKLKLFLSSQILSFIGLRSYGLYLWHWPLLVFSKYLWPENIALSLCLPVLLTVSISILSYHFIENPLRHKNWGFKEAIPISFGVIGTALITYNYSTSIKTGYNYAVFSGRHKTDLTSLPCHSSQKLNALDKCLPNSPGNSRQRIILIGDSHAGHLRSILDKIDADTIQLTDRNIPNLFIGKKCKESHYCFESKDLFNKLDRISNANTLIIFGMSPKRISGPNKTESDTSRFVRELETSLTKLTDVAIKNDARLILISGLPQIKCTKGTNFEMLYNQGGPKMINKKCSLSRKEATRLNNSQLTLYKKLEERYTDSVIIFNPMPYVCGKLRCQLIDDSGELIMWDNQGHLTEHGKELLSPKLKSVINKFLFFPKIN